MEKKKWRDENAYLKKLIPKKTFDAIEHIFLEAKLPPESKSGIVIFFATEKCVNAKLSSCLNIMQLLSLMGTMNKEMATFIEDFQIKLHKKDIEEHANSNKFSAM